METAKLIVDLIGKLIWPAVIITIVLLFRKYIVQRIPYISKFKAGGMEIEVMQSVAKKIVEEAIEDSNSHNQPEVFNKIIYQENVANSIGILVKPGSTEEGDKTLLALTANWSMNENMKFGVYYDPVTRNHNSPFRYMGLYKSGKISAIGKYLKVVCCDLIEGKLVATNGDNIEDLSNDEYNRIKGIIMETNYYNLRSGCKFFLVDKFFDTEFVKSSAYALRGKKYIWLDTIEGFKPGMRTERLAELLKDKTWE